MSANTLTVSRGTRTRKRKPDRAHDREPSDASPRATAPSDEKPAPLPYRLKRENPYCWAICRLHRRKGQIRYEAFQWYPRLEQAADRLAELYLDTDLGWVIVELADIRKAISELKARLTDEMIERMTIR